MNHFKNNKAIYKGIAAFILFVIILWISNLIKDNETVKNLVQQFGYFGVAFIAFISGFNVIIPVPAISFLPIFTEAGLNTILIVLVVSIGMALGDGLGYFLGRYGREVIDRTSWPKWLQKSEEFLNKYKFGLPIFLFLYACFAPLPNELVVIPAAATKQKWWLIMPPVFLGNLVFNTLIALGISVFAYSFVPHTSQVHTTPTPISVSTSTSTLTPTPTPTPVSTLISTSTPVLTSSIERFVIPLTATTTDQIINILYDQGYVKNKTTFSLALKARGVWNIEPGGYRFSNDMSALQIANVLKSEPYMKWIVITPGLRKEEIAEILAKTFKWSNSTKQKWITTDTAKPDYTEGTFFPDSYLIPIDESPAEITNRIIANFNSKFAPYLKRFNEQNIRWTTGITFASIVQREAASNADMPLIAGILWNRLEEGMPLQVDATLQYVRGDKGEGWWAPIKVADKEIDSPYNTYKNRGLPPGPISNPGIAAIEATLSPTKTNCLYYLHDKERNTHCAETYEEHLENIDRYLKEE